MRLASLAAASCALSMLGALGTWSALRDGTVAALPWIAQLAAAGLSAVLFVRLLRERG